MVMKRIDLILQDVFDALETDFGICLPSATPGAAGNERPANPSDELAGVAGSGDTQEEETCVTVPGELKRPSRSRDQWTVRRPGPRYGKADLMTEAPPIERHGRTASRAPTGAPMQMAVRLCLATVDGVRVHAFTG